MKTTPVRILQQIPSWFWFSKVIHKLPTDPKHRKYIYYEVLDLKHDNWCNNTEFDCKIVDSCIFRFCGRILQHFHERYCKPDLAEDMKSVKSCISQISPVRASYPKVVNIMPQLRVQIYPLTLGSKKCFPYPKVSLSDYAYLMDSYLKKKTHENVQDQAYSIASRTQNL